MKKDESLRNFAKKMVGNYILENGAIGIMYHILS